MAIRLLCTFFFVRCVSVVLHGDSPGLGIYADSDQSDDENSSDDEGGRSIAKDCETDDEGVDSDAELQVGLIRQLVRCLNFLEMPRNRLLLTYWQQTDLSV